MPIVFSKSPFLQAIHQRRGSFVTPQPTVPSSRYFFIFPHLWQNKKLVGTFLLSIHWMSVLLLFLVFHVCACLSLITFVHFISSLPCSIYSADFLSFISCHAAIFLSMLSRVIYSTPFPAP